MTRAGGLRQSSQAIIIQKWKKLDRGRVKCNVDTTMVEEGRSTSISIVVRNDEGNFVKRKMICLQDSMLVQKAEAMGLKEALSWCLELQIPRVIIKLDAKIVVDTF